MKNIFSLLAIVIVGVVLVQCRVVNITREAPLNLTRWDALGYYMYLPAVFVYNDFKQLSWLDEVDKQYNVTGGDGIPATKLEDGNYTSKYLSGVAIMQSPLFLAGHLIAGQTGHAKDGFSPPYQYALGFGIILYCMLALLLLRTILLRYFSDSTTALTLILVTLASNAIVYISVDSGLSHAYIFVLYTLVIFTTMKWHEKPSLIGAALTGLIIGLATISRPTEAIMLFIPLFWGTQNHAAAKEKWAMVKSHKLHVAAAVLFGFVGILPQLMYWKATTGSFIYDVGSKWDFLNPHFRVLFGWEKGWFIYTPGAILFVVGMFFVRRFPFRKAVLWFCLLHIWIIIAWHEWHYAASYYTRALVQSYPVFALALAALIQQITSSRLRLLLYLASVYLVAVNLFQVSQYTSGVLHYDDMNRRYYGSIYLNPDPTPLDMSLLDNNDMPPDLSDFSATLMSSQQSTQVDFSAGSFMLLQHDLASNTKENWLSIEAEILAPNSLWQSYLNAELHTPDSVKAAKVRLFRPLTVNDKPNRYHFYLEVPEQFAHCRLSVFLSSPHEFNGELKMLKVTHYMR